MILTYLYLTDPEEILQAIDEMEQEAELWIDVETAGWYRGEPRVSLLQARNRAGLIWVLDLLEHDLILEDEFIPRIMASADCTKYAHNAHYERDLLGGELVTNLECTLQMARRSPYIGQSGSKLGLAALVKHFFGVTIDKMYQRANWGRRPLRQPMLEYAAADTEWCFHIHQMCLAKGATYTPDNPEDDERRLLYMNEVNTRYRSKTVTRNRLEDPGPVEIRDAYREVIDERHRFARIQSSIEYSVRKLMEDETLDVFSGFQLDFPEPDQFFIAVQDENRKILGKLSGLPAPMVFFSELPLLCALLDRVNLEDETPVMVDLPKPDRERLSASALSTLEQAATVSLRFRGLNAKPFEAPTYLVTLDSHKKVITDYRHAKNEHRRLSVKRERLRDRIRVWMELNGLDRWGGFSYQRLNTWSIELRKLAALPLPDDYLIAVPKRLVPFMKVKTKKRRFKAHDRILRWMLDDYESK